MRLPRLDSPGARHHVMNRGARHEPILASEDAKQVFLTLLADLPQRFGIAVHGYVLMPNHYHLMLETVTGELPRAMRHLGGEFARRLNTELHWDGPVFKGRYRNRIVGTDSYWRHLLAYLHLNPIRAGLGEDYLRWSSHPAYVGTIPRPEWLTTTELQGLFGDLAGYLSYLESTRTGLLPVPADFDQRKLWTPHSTGTAAIPPVEDRSWELAEALQQVQQVTGQTLAQLLHSPNGRLGNPANWLAMWWLSRGCGIDHGKITRVMFASHSTVSNRIRRVEERRQTDVVLARWLQALQIARASGIPATAPIAQAAVA